MSPYLAILGGLALPVVVVLTTAGGERLLRAARPRTQERIRPWLWLWPILLLFSTVIVYPAAMTVLYVFRGPDADSWVGLDNIVGLAAPAVLGALVNSLIWLLVLPIVTVAIATFCAVLIDRIRFQTLARTALVLPIALSGVVAALAWRITYLYEPPGRDQRGTLNAVLQLFGLDPVTWISRPPADGAVLNTLGLIVLAVWGGLGIGLLIISAALKTVPVEQVEAARLDGAGEWRVFTAITLPAIAPSLVVVLTTTAIVAVKMFDAVYVMTGGRNGTEVLGTLMYERLFSMPRDLGEASTIALLMLLLSLPLAIVNLRRARAEAAR